MRSVPRCRGLLLGIGASTVLASAFWMGCSERVNKSDSTHVVDSSAARLPVMDKDCPLGEPPTTKAELDACLKSELKFDDRPLLGDEQRLMVFDTKSGPPCPGAPTLRNCRLGPLARIQPEMHAHQWDRTLVQREGRLIARMTLSSSKEERYPKLALIPGHVTYWWVLIDPSGTGGRSRFVSDSVKPDGTLYFVERKLVVEESRRNSFQHAIARWLWLPDDETSKGNCSSSSSCK